MQVSVSEPDAGFQGQAIRAWRLATAAVELQGIALGGIITSLRVPDREGHWDNVVLGYDAAEMYVEDQHYLGAVVGRYANRIANGRFSLNGHVHQLATNDGSHHLHGGVAGFNRFVWDLEVVQRDNATGIRLTRVSPHGEEGYPGTLHAGVTYWLTGDNVVVIEYEASTDRTTLVNLTQHAYFNLTGRPGATVLDHSLRIDAEHYLPVDETLIPIGRIDGVAGTPFDFRTERSIGTQLAAGHDQLRIAAGFDHNFVLTPRREEPTPAASLYDAVSGRRLDVSTTEPGLQLYTGQLLDRHPARGSGRRAYSRHEGLCLETQHFPDSPNHPEFPSTRLAPDARHRSVTSWKLTND
jgi:aldose 1-epimerase